MFICFILDRPSHSIPFPCTQFTLVHSLWTSEKRNFHFVCPSFLPASEQISLFSQKKRGEQGGRGTSAHLSRQTLKSRKLSLGREPLCSSKEEVLMSQFSSFLPFPIIFQRWTEVGYPQIYSVSHIYICNLYM